MAFAAGPIAHPALKTSPIGAVELVWLASPAVASAFAGGEAMLPVWSLASHSPIHGRMREAIAASRIAQKSLNLCNNARTMIAIAKAGGGHGLFPRPTVGGHMAGGGQRASAAHGRPSRRRSVG